MDVNDIKFYSMVQFMNNKSSKEQTPEFKGARIEENRRRN